MNCLLLMPTQYSASKKVATIVLSALRLVANVWWTSASTASAHGIAADRRGAPRVTPLGKFERQRPGDGICLSEPKSQALTDPIGFSAFLPDQHPSVRLVAEIFGSKVLGKYKTIAAEVLDRGEEAERLDPGDATFDQLSHLIRQKGRDVTIDRFPLCFHRPSFKYGNLLANVLKPFFVANWQSAFAELVSLHQRTMDEEVGIATDRR